MKTCPRCGRTFDDALAFCQYDATPLVAIAPIPPPRPIPVPQPVPVQTLPPEVPEYLRETPKRGQSNRIAWIVVGALALVGLLGLGGYFLFNRAPVEEIDSNITEETAPPPEADNATIRIERWMTVTNPGQGYLNLRRSPVRSSNIVAAMQTGSSVYVRYCENRVEIGASKRAGRWCFLDYGSLSGWAFDAFLAG